MIKDKKYIFTRKKWDEALRKADEIMKRSNGHSYITMLKTRCLNCGRSPKQKGICRHWQMSLIEHLYQVLTKNHE